MDIEAIARSDAATKTLNVKKNKGYDDVVISEYDYKYFCSLSMSKIALINNFKF
uniref:Phage protein n=1 Tax=Elaeophora elaphi TaxID=1147741 RepID=A0A0R3S5S7_9BILA